MQSQLLIYENQNPAAGWLVEAIEFISLIENCFEEPLPIYSLKNITKAFKFVCKIYVFLLIHHH